jgi:hypothetical protein
MELEYQLAELIGKAQTDEQWRNALNAYGDTAWSLSGQEKERIQKLLNEASNRITKQNNQFYDLCFEIRKTHGFHNVIAKPLHISEGVAPMESDGTPVVEDFTDEELTSENIAKVASTLILK